MSRMPLTGAGLAPHRDQRNMATRWGRKRFGRGVQAEFTLDELNRRLEVSSARDFGRWALIYR